VPAPCPVTVAFVRLQAMGTGWGAGTQAAAAKGRRARWPERRTARSRGRDRRTVYSPAGWRDTCRRATRRTERGVGTKVLQWMFVAGAEHHNLKPRARSEGMATRRGVRQVATTPPDRYALGMGVTKAGTCVVARVGDGGDLGGR